MKRKLVFGIIIFLTLLSAICLYFYYPFYQTSKINKFIDIAGIKLLMPLEEVTGQMNGDGEYIYGMGGFGCRYKNEQIAVFFSNDSDGQTYNKVSFIETENPRHSVLDIHPGDSLDKAFSILHQLGFKQEDRNYYKKGSIYINLIPENYMVKKIRVGFIDRSLSGRVY